MNFTIENISAQPIVGIRSQTKMAEIGDKIGMKEQNLEPAGAPWEHYLNDPCETPPESLQTRIVWPIR